MSLLDRLGDLITAIGADVKALNSDLDTFPSFHKPPSGAYLMPRNLLGMGAGTVPSGQATFWALDVGHSGLSIQSFACNVTTARVGGTVVEKIALYEDDGTGGMPLISADGLIVSGSVNLSGSTGLRTISDSRTLSQGRYWGCFFYYASVAPGTAPQCTCGTNATALWSGSSLFSTVTRYLKIASLTDLPTGGQTPVPAGDSVGGIVGLKAA